MYSDKLFILCKIQDSAMIDCETKSISKFSFEWPLGYCSQRGGVETVSFKGKIFYWDCRGGIYSFDPINKEGSFLYNIDELYEK